jgi:hypothetical protein
MRAKRRKDQEHHESPFIRRRRLRRWLIGVPSVLIGVLVLLWSVPVIVAHTSLRQTIVSAALADFEGSVTIGSASLGWLSPLLARDVEARDLRGQPLGRAAALQSEKSLLGLLSDTSRPGVFRVSEPTLQLALRPDGSNWEDAVAKLLSGPSQGTAVRALTIQVEGGTLEVHDTARNGQFRLDQLNLALQMDDASPLPIKVRAAAAVVAQGKPPGQLSVDLAWKPGETDATYYGDGQVTLRGETVPLAAMSSLAQRFLGDIQAQGAASGDALWQWKEGGNRQRLQVDRLETGALTLRAPDWFGPDVLQTDTLRGSAQLETAGDSWNIERLTLDTDFAQLAAQGVLQADDLTSVADWAKLVSQVPAVDLKIDGRVDLAKLTQMLPATLKLRPSTQVKSGLVTLSLVNKATDPPRLEARLEASDLAAIENGKEFTWQKPILVTANLHRSSAGPVIDELTCRSSFLDVTAQGTPSEGTAVVRGDLHQLATDAGRFIDLSGYQIGGRIDGSVRWQRSRDDQVAADGKLKLNDFELSTSGQQPWRERELTLDLAAAAALRGGQIQRILSASVQVHSGSDVLKTDLLQPVATVGPATAWPLGLKATGNLATWLPRLRPFVPVGDRRLAGNLNLDATARVSAQKVDADSVKLQIDQFQSREWDLAIDEPTVRLDAKGTWDAVLGRVTAQDVAMTSSTVAFRAQQVVLQLPSTGPMVSGKLTYRADVGRLGQWLQTPGKVATEQLTGAVTGSLEATHEAGVTQVSWNSDAENLVYAARRTGPSPAGPALAAASSPWEEVWREPSVKLTSRERYDHQRDVLEIQELTATGNSLRLVAAGRIEQWSGRRQAELSGEVDYDWADVSAKLRPYLGSSVQITGRDKGRFALTGPLRELPSQLGQAPGRPTSEFLLTSATSPVSAARGMVPTDLAGSARVGWESGSLYGLLLGKGDLKASLANGVLQFAPLQIPVSEGQFRMVSKIELNATPARLSVDKGQLIDNVRISPELCRTWLKYVAPLLADATRAEGRFSALLDGAKIPLSDVDKSDVHGQLTIHSAQVGPGPVAQQFLGLAQQVKMVLDGRPVTDSLGGASTWLLIPQQTVRVDVENGRVSHQGLTMTAGDVTIRTSGSVGLDETLAIMAEVPIRDEWVADKKYLSSLRGTVIQIPMQGTLSKPRLDNRMLSELSARMVGGAARGVLQDEVNRGLQRLFGPTMRGAADGAAGGTP